MQLLHASRGLTIDGKPLQIWADLIPPSESPRFNHSQCSVPADSPLTDFDELSLFDLTDGLRGCTDCETDAPILHTASMLASMAAADVFAYRDTIHHQPNLDACSS